MKKSKNEIIDKPDLICNKICCPTARYGRACDQLELCEKIHKEQPKVKVVKWPEQTLWDKTVVAAIDEEPKLHKAPRTITKRNEKVISKVIHLEPEEEPTDEVITFKELLAVYDNALPMYKDVLNLDEHISIYSRSFFDCHIITPFQKHLVMTPGLATALKLIYAVVLSTKFRDDTPLWLDIVGSPSTGKTMLLSCVKDCSTVLFKSRITPASFVSGAKNVKSDPSILGKLNDHCLVWKDFTEILAMRSEDRERIYAAMRGAYDGHSHTDFGNGVIRDYKDIYYTMLTGVTNRIYLDTSVSLGERRLKYKLPRISTQEEQQKIQTIIDSQENFAEACKELKETSRCFIVQTKRSFTTLPEVPKSILEKITALAILGSRLRTQIDREKYDSMHHMQILPESEEGIRLAKQLKKLAQMLAMVAWKETVDERDLKIVKEVVLSSPHPFVTSTFQAFQSLNGQPKTRIALSERSGLPSTTLSRVIKDLALMNVVECTEKGGKPKGEIGGKTSDNWKLTEEISEFCVKSEV